MWIPTTIVPSICPTLCVTLPPSPASMGSPPSLASPTGPSPTALPPQSTGWVPPALPLPLQSLPPSRCFSFGIGDRASTALIKGFARAVGGSAEFITGQDCTQPKVLQSLKWAMQPAVTGISLSWDLPPGMQAELLHWDPEVIFAGQRCLVYAQLRRQPQPPDIPMGGFTLQYRIQDQTYKETLQLSLQPQNGDRAGTGGVSLAEAGVSAKCRRLVEPGPPADCCAGGERDQHQGEDVTPSIWATVLAMVWLHGRAVGQPDESSCWRPRLWAGCGTEQVQTRAGQTFSS
ncbi:unnamed protein product [Eretmochelys imbricata]